MRPPGSPRQGDPGRLEYRRAAGERPPRARPQRRGSPGPIPNPAVKPAFAESTAAKGCGRAGRRARGGRFSLRAQGAASPRRKLASCAPGEARRGIAPCGPLLRHGPGPRRVLRLCGVKRRASPKGPRRIAWEAVEGPLRSRARSTADGRVSCPCRPATGGSLFRALPAFWGGLGVAGGVASSAGVLSRRGVPCWAGSARSMRRRFCVGPLAGFFCVNGGLAI